MNKLIIYIFLVLVFFISCEGSRRTIKSSGVEDGLVRAKYADMLKVSESEIENVALYSFIDEWYGVKYQYGGLTKEGVDCSGFCNLLYRNVYGKQIDRTTSELSKRIQKIGKEELKEGDVVFFNISGKNNAHVGVYLLNNKFVHASTSSGVTISDLQNPYYKKNYNKGGRLK